MNNRKMGNSFESELSEILSQHGFWVHMLCQNAAGQPADVIAVRNGKSYLIDCKVCSTAKGFALSRVEENQELSMGLWENCGNGQGWFAMKLPNGAIIMVPNIVVKAWSFDHSYMSASDIFENGKSLEKWVMWCR